MIDSVANMAFALLAAIGLVYLILMILVRLLLVPVVILFALPLVVIGAFVVLAVTGHALDPSDLICTRAWPLGAGRIWYL